MASHVIGVENAETIKQGPYRLHHQRSKLMEGEIQYMLRNEIIEPRESEWASPCVLAEKNQQVDEILYGLSKVK